MALAERAAAEVGAGRAYIAKLEGQLRATEATLAFADKVGGARAEIITELQGEAESLRVTIAREREANKLREAALADVTRRLEKTIRSRNFWRRVAAVTTASLAAVTAAVILRN